MVTHVRKWGNSLAVRLPKQAASRLKLREGSALKLVTQRMFIYLRPLPRKAATLRELVASIRPQMRHEEMNWGKSVGREVW